MRLASMIAKARDGVSRRLDRRIEPVDAVFDAELWAILDSFGLLKQLDAGELTCYLTGVPLTRDNIGALVGTPEGPRPVGQTLRP